MTASPVQPTRISILLRLYPRDWRARYGDELAGILADTALTPANVLDVVLGALDAHWSGDYPSAVGDDRKVRRPMIDRLSALLTAAAGALFVALMLVAYVAPPPEVARPGANPLLIALALGLPMAMAAMAVGIAGLSLGWLGADTVGRSLGLVASALAIGITLAIWYMFFIGDAGWDALLALFPGFAAATGLVGLRITLSRRDRLPGIVLLAAGAITSALSLTVILPTNGAPAITALSFGIATIAWSLVGLLRLRPMPIAAATA